MGLYKTPGIVLRSMDLGEKDKLVTLMTEKFGKIKCVAKSARRMKSRFGASLEPLSYVHILYFGKEYQTLYQLNQADIRKSFQHIRENLDKLYRGLYFVELIDSLVTEGHPEPQLFDLLLEGLETLQEGNDLEPLCRLFELRIMAGLGYTPRLDLCISCKLDPGPGELGFSFLRKGVLCGPCTRKYQPETRITPGTLNTLRRMLSIEIRNSSRLKFPRGMEEEIGAITRRMVLAHLGRELRTYAFIKNMALV
ncbi:MAG: DNA repair protein RecO [Nitrospinae bacterium CG11_big_fil_rev_8_21_14_0_20_56_8]|nr:MAG: DNA repair protein RecO [Nitrospinae bacterium CG11_big_fil_rev_8_21_14_0_20_56_8]